MNFNIIVKIQNSRSQFYKISLLNWLLLIVIVINVMIGGFSREDLR